MKKSQVHQMDRLILALPKTAVTDEVRRLEDSGDSKSAIQLLQGTMDSLSREDKLITLIHIGNIYLKEKEEADAFSILNTAKDEIFRASTPRHIQDAFDDLRGNSYILRGNFLLAAQSFAYLMNHGGNAEIRSYALRMSAITSVFAPATSHRRTLINSFLENESFSSLDVAPMIKLISSLRFVDQAHKDDFVAAINGILPSTYLEQLSSSIEQHNLIVAQSMFSRVRIERLAEFIGNTPEAVERQIIFLIENNSIHALIDQPSRTIVFPAKKKISQDESISEFSACVAALCKEIKSK